MAYSLYNIYFITPIIIIGGLLQGFDISSMSAIASNKTWQKRFGNPNAATQGGITASISGGSFLGYFVNMLTIDRFGRRATLQIGSLDFIVGAILCAASVAVPMLIVGRVLYGLAAGLFTSTGPTYLAELAPREVRGRILSLQQWSITYGCSFTKTEAVFRVPWTLQIVPAIIMFIGLVLCATLTALAGCPRPLR
ncbi:high affinity glucose transporter [Sporothrix stenoceras]|uniref:High affinity glucose transporter n=1 Tax=Sporothrix stenoceras TaxID=5173 RepID=A0ABR3YUG1_9PEZI